MGDPAVMQSMVDSTVYSRPAISATVEPGVQIGPDGQVQEDRVDEFLQHRKFPVRSVLSYQQVDATLEGAELLAEAGCWSQIPLLSQTQKWKQYASDVDRMKKVHCVAIALCKLNRKTEALNEIYKLGELDSAQWVQGGVSVVPFSLRLLRAELLSYQSGVNQEPKLRSVMLKASEEALHSLLTQCEAMVPHNPPLWEGRLRAVGLKLVDCYMEQVEPCDETVKDYASCALKRMADLTDRFPTDLDLLQRYACLLMRLGQVNDAQTVFNRITNLPDTTPGLEDSIASLLGLLEVCGNEFNEAAFPDTANRCNSNNKAVCAVYSADLPRAIQLLEDAIRQDPNRTLTETLVSNLCTLYELEAAAPEKKKRLIKEVVERYIGDSFESAAFKL